MSNSTVAFLPPPPPPGLNYIAAIKPSLTLLLIGTVWSSMLIPLLIVLLVFSTPGLRRQPLFILNLVAVLVGIILGIMIIYMEVTAIIAPLTSIKASVFIGFVTLNLFIPVLMDTILIVRLFAVYPPRSISWPRRCVVFVPPITFKIIRTANLIIFLIKWTKLIHDGESPLFGGQALWGDQPWTKIEWFFQVFDNCYASMLFLLRVHKARTINAQTSALGSLGNGSYSAKLRNLFFIAVGNFVFPCMLSLVQLIFLFRDPNFLDGSYVFLTNCYVAIIGVLLATIWVAGSQWSDDNKKPRPVTDISAIQYAPQIRIGKSAVTDSSLGQSTTTMGGANDAMEMDAFKAAPRKYSG
ncbi:hypothetical protein C8J57DRAFT_1060122 [Mycena rebaudengoi]|nr:hypothetical protein C8J57DRAFT_1060122 [Mycena rebaudengoi]